ncbi:MAG: hypothetical protein J2P25_24020, partial [Nocardiopsaceae bacterium]|nr:hypothetical protein [Nocardiopsaceae bacterium]
VTAACSGAVAAHRGWRFGAALAALVSPWQGQLARVGEAIAGDGDRLAGTADTYGTTEADNTGLSRSADRLLP